MPAPTTTLKPNVSAAAPAPISEPKAAPLARAPAAVIAPAALPPIPPAAADATGLDIPLSLKALYDSSPATTPEAKEVPIRPPAPALTNASSPSPADIRPLVNPVEKPPVNPDAIVAGSSPTPACLNFS